LAQNKPITFTWNNLVFHIAFVKYSLFYILLFSSIYV
jgi:hypothetical protein